MAQTHASEIDWQVNAKVDSRPIVRIGMWSIGVTMLVFILWGSLFQLDSAVITPGTLVSEGRNKLIQHSIGGRVARIYVREGEMLEKGDVVLELDPSKAQADLSKMQARHASLSALKARLEAERIGGNGAMRQVPKVSGGLRLGAGRSVFKTGTVALRGAGSTPFVLIKDPIADVIASNDQQVEEARDNVMESQLDAYASGRSLLSKEVSALERKSETLAKQKESQLARIAAQIELFRLTRKEVARMKPLAISGYVARNKLESRQKELAELRGNVAAMSLDAAAFDTQMAEIDVQIERAKIAKSDAASKEYARIVAELAEVDDQRRAARASVRDMYVHAPVSGRLTNMSVTTEGGVFGSGDVVGEIVPADAPLLVEARVAPSDIDFVRIGQQADVAITAFDRRLDDSLSGTVSYVSADAEKDEKTGDQYFVARLKFAAAGENAKNISKLQAGMQGEVYIHTGSRTFLTYLSKPLLDSFRRAFRER